MTTQEIVDYYTSLLIVQYVSLNNANSHVAALIRETLQNQIIIQVQTAFDIDDSLGAQLNIIGEYRGISRILFGSSAGADWSIPEYADASPGSYLGLVEYADPDPAWLTLQYDDLDNLSYALSDIQMRTLIKLKAAIDSWDGTIGGLDTILFDFFGIYVNVVDTGSMSLIYQHTASDPDPNTIWKMAVLAGILPHPAGVAFTTVEV